MEQNKLKLEDCCLTIEQAKELQELGVNTKNSIYLYGEDRMGDNEPLTLVLRNDVIGSLDIIKSRFDITGTLTNTEMLEMLPQYIYFNKKLRIYKDENMWIVSYEKDGQGVYVKTAELLRDALFEMIKFLKKLII